MTHKIQRKIADISPYEIVLVELIPETEAEKISLKNVDEATKDYLMVVLEAVDIFKTNPPFFEIKKVKSTIGFGK